MTACTLVRTSGRGIEHEADLHRKYANYALQGEWFKGNILREVQEIIAKDAATPRQPKTNVMVCGDSDTNFIMSSDQQQMMRKASLQVALSQALDEIHVKTPIDWVITGGERQHDHFAWAWATQHKVQIHRFLPNWKKYGRVAGFKVGPQMLRSQFDPKLLLVMLSGRGGTSATSMIRAAAKAHIETVVKRLT